jgi:5-methylcytosine-specific restriction endonuclease McrA
VTVTCEECGTQEQVRPYRAATYRFCSYACKAKWRMKHWRGDKNPKWTGGVREKVCQYCGKTFAQHRRRAISVFAKQKFCSKKCADKGGLRYFGPDNAKWTGNPRRKHRKSKHGAWARVVISPDGAKCQVCRVQGVELHAHHIKSYKEHPELRWDLSNGVTVCHSCHWDIHGSVQNLSHFRFWLSGARPWLTR